MIKAIFVDLFGTITDKYGDNVKRMAKVMCFDCPKVKDVNEMIRVWLKTYDKIEKEAIKEQDFVTCDAIIERVYNELVEKYELDMDFRPVRDLMRDIWICGDTPEDVQPFLNNSPLPVYLLTNCTEKYVKKFFTYAKLSGFAGVITPDMAQTYKPAREYYAKALEVAGVNADEVIHIGDSNEDDIKGAKACGIRGVLINRHGRFTAEGVESIRSLEEIFELCSIK